MVGGVVAMFGFLNGTLTTSTQRYLNYELGTGNTNRIRLVFSTALLQHLLLIILIVLLAETVGLWFVIEKLNVPEGRETAALLCYQFSIIAACVQVFQLPFMSTIIAHERMGVYAYISIFDVIAKLLIVYLIQVTPADRLVFYAFLILMVSIINAIIYDVYCVRHFDEARISLKTEKTLFKEMLDFSGWNVVGSLASALNNYGLNIIFNLFFGTVVNAARGISYQVSSIITQFSNNFQIAVKPQVVKYYANKQMREMTNLIYNSAKYSALLLLVIAIPVSIEIEFILSLWLGDFPEHTANFVRIILATSVLGAITNSVIMLVHASGYVKMVSITAGCFKLLLLPLNYILLKLGCSPETTLLINCIGVFVESLIELFWMHHYLRFPIMDFLVTVYLKIVLLALFMTIIPYSLHNFIKWNNEFVRFLTVSASSAIVSLSIFYFFGLNDNMRKNLNKKIMGLLNNGIFS